MIYLVSLALVHCIQKELPKGRDNNTRKDKLSEQTLLYISILHMNHMILIAGVARSHMAVLFVIMLFSFEFCEF